MDLTNDIISFLFSYRKLNLPGLGLLVLIKTPAKRNVAKNKILGPDFYLEFHDNQYDERIFSDFVNYLSSKHKISFKKAENIFRKYSLELLNNIANFGSAAIDNLGAFSRKKNKLHFELSPVLAEIIKESYPDYSLPYIKRKEKKNIPPPVVKPYNTGKNTSSTNWIFPFFILTISSIVIACMIYCFSNLMREKTDKHLVADSIKSSTNKIMPPDSSEEFIFGNENSVTDTQQSGKISNTGLINQDSVKLNQKTDTIPVKITLEKLIKMAPELRSEYEKTCIIITGSFIKKYNARRMIKRLQKAGFSPYSERYGKFHRTGVVFDCNKKPLRVFLKELRQSIDKDSWVLKWK